MIGVGVAGTSAIAASNSNNYPPIVQKLADRFHLNPSDVQSVFKENQQDRQTRHQAALKARLDQAVKDGKISQAQEDALIAELQTLKAKRQAENKTDRMADKQQMHDELTQWAQANSINIDGLLPAPHLKQPNG